MIIPAELKALVIDDNEYALALAKDALRQLGIKSIVCAKDATTGLQLAQNNDFSFVLLDWYMPDINGAGFVRLVRGGQAGCSADLPIIIATAYATRENTRRIRDLGLKEILIKPFDVRQLGLAVSLAVSKGQLPTSNESQNDNDDDEGQVLL